IEVTALIPPRVWTNHREHKEHRKSPSSPFFLCSLCSLWLKPNDYFGILAAPEWSQVEDYCQTHGCTPAGGKIAKHATIH
ncbi:MAG: hypothetical protein NTW21_26495, partial [Verrucomicrobia bacterium]|nr:hypothetical protein [Verrucomicrobiota bacterium]